MKRNYIFALVRYSLCMFVLFNFTVDTMAQNYSSKYNSLLKRYEYFDSKGNLIGYKKWNSLYDRWEYIDTQKQSNSYENSSYYNLDLIQKIMIQKQQQGDHNLNLIYDKLEEICEILDNVVNTVGELNSSQLNIVTQFEKEVNEKCRCDLSNNGNVRKILLWLNQRKRYFSSWINNSQSNSNNIPNTAYFKSSVIIWDDSNIVKGKQIGTAKGVVKVLEKVTDVCYKIEFNGIIGYIYGSLDR